MLLSTTTFWNWSKTDLLHCIIREHLPGPQAKQTREKQNKPNGLASILFSSYKKFLLSLKNETKYKARSLFKALFVQNQNVVTSASCNTTPIHITCQSGPLFWEAISLASHASVCLALKLKLDIVKSSVWSPVFLNSLYRDACEEGIAYKQHSLKNVNSPSTIHYALHAS